MPAVSALVRAIKAFAAVARRRRMRWYIFGGQAVAVHGRPRMDVVLAGAGLEAEFLARARTVDLGGVRAPVISPEDLVVTKLLAGRPQDRADVAGILQHRRGKLELGRVRALLAELERALEQSDLTAGLDALIAETAPAPTRRPRRR